MPTVRIFDFICEVSYLMFDTKLKNICETWPLFKWRKSDRLWEESNSNFVWRLTKEDKRDETNNGK